MLNAKDAEIEGMAVMLKTAQLQVEALCAQIGGKADPKAQESAQSVDVKAYYERKIGAIQVCNPCWA